MKKIILPLSFALILGACNTPVNNTKAESTDSLKTVVDTTKLAKGAIFYQCEMNLEVLSDKPGKCPKCGMDLEEIRKR